MERLIKCSDYVIEVSNRQLDFDSHNLDSFSYDNLHRIYKYANFLKRPLELGLFIPTDKDGNVLEPTVWNLYKNFNAWELLTENELNRTKQYQEAQSRVMFKGCYIEIIFGENWLISPVGRLARFTLWKPNFFQYKTIEDLCKLGLELTENAVNELKK